MSQPHCLMKALSGDRGAMEELAGICYPAVFGYAARLSGSREQARDLAQDVMVRMLESLETYRMRPGASFMAWLFRIARNRFIDSVRRRRDDAPLPEGGEGFAGNDTTSLAALSHMEAEGLKRAFGKLAHEDREILALRHYYGFSHKEIAGILGVRPQIVKSRLNAALARLRKQYAAEERGNEYAGKTAQSKRS